MGEFGTMDGWPPWEGAARDGEATADARTDATPDALGRTLPGPTASGSLTGDPEPRVGASLLEGRYALVRELGRGGMGVVYLAEDVRRGAFVAVKLGPPAGFDPDADARFEREAVTLATLRHPNIVRVHTMGFDASGRRYIVMDYVEGETVAAILARLRARREWLPVPRAIELVTGVAAGLGAAHAAGLVHRDVSATNVIVGPDGRPVLTDFGLARAAHARSSPALLVGTPRYLAPELLRGEPIAPSDAHLPDVYALGVLAYELLTGRPPFDGPDFLDLLQQIREAEPPPPSALRPEIPRVLDRILLRALAKDPHARPRSCADFALALQALGDVTLRATTGSRLRPRAPVVVATSNRHLATRVATVLVRELVSVDLVCEHAVDGEEAWATCRERRPRLVVGSPELPGLNLLELVALLRAREDMARVPICIVATRPLSREDRDLFARFAVDAVLDGDVPDARLAAIARELLRDAKSA